MKFSTFLSTFANTCNFIGIASVFIAILLVGEKKGKEEPFVLSTFPVFFGIVLYAFEGIGLIIPIHNAMEEPKHYNRALVGTMTFVCFLYSIFGVVLYSVLAQNTPEMITEAIGNHYYALRLLVLIFLIISIIASLNLVVQPIYEAFDNCFFPVLNKSSYDFKLIKDGVFDDNSVKSFPEKSVKSKESNTEKSKSYKLLKEEEIENEEKSEAELKVIKVNAITSLKSGFCSLRYRREGAFFWIMSTFVRFCILVVIALPSLTPLKKHFAYFIGLIGGTVGSFTNFVVPCLLHIRLLWSTMQWWQRVLDVSALLFAIPAMIITTVFTLLELIAIM